MWRLWTRGWGPEYWWHWFKHEGFPLWVANHLPKRITLWAFILVSAAPQNSPTTYEICYDHWVDKHNLRNI